MADSEKDFHITIDEVVSHITNSMQDTFIDGYGFEWSVSGRGENIIVTVDKDLKLFDEFKLTIERIK